MGAAERFLVRSRGNVLVDVELVPGAYMIGRSAECALHLAHGFVSRRHGSLWHEEGAGWRYRDLRQEGAESVDVTDDDPIALGPGLELVTGAYITAHETQSRPLPKKRRPWLWTTAVVLIALLTGGGYFGYQRASAPLSAGALLERARPGVVSLEELPSPDVRATLLAQTELTEDDFRESAPFCSGFIVARDVVLTANHCVQSADGQVETDFVITTDDGTRHEPSRVLGYNVKRDYLFLEVPGLDADEPFALRDEFELGARVYTLGNVEGQGLALRDGIAASVTQDQDRRGVDFLRFSAPVSGGNSGGPLLDERGDVLGLVFARNRSETYNLATSSEHLTHGMERWVEVRDGDTIPVSAHDFEGLRAANTLVRLGYPSPGRWYERPELVSRFQALQYTQRVPVTLDELSAEVTATLDDTIRPAFDATMAELVQDEALYRWEDLIDDEHPVAMPVRAARPLARHQERALAGGLAVCSPSDYASSRDSAASSASCARYRFDSDHSTEDRLVYRPWRSTTRPTFGRGLFGSMRSRLHLAEVGPAASPTAGPTAPISVEAMIGEDGLLLDLSRAEYLRPRARRAYPLDALPSNDPIAIRVEDGAGRPWVGYRVPVLDQGNLVVLCKAFPGGRVCDGRFTIERDETALDRWIQNHARYELASQVLDPVYFDPDALAGWTATDDFALPRDVSYEAGVDGGRLVLGTAALEIRIDGTAEVIRVRRALTRVDGEVTWFASGADVVVEQDGSRTLCSTVLREAPDSASGMDALITRLHSTEDGASVHDATVGDDGAELDIVHRCVRLTPQGEAFGERWRPSSEQAPVTVHAIEQPAS